MSASRSKIIPVSMLFMLSVWAFAALHHWGHIPEPLGIFIFAMIMIAGIYAFFTHMRRYEEAKQGFAVEDELSTRIRYKAGYYAFMTSLYIWIAIFLFQRFIPDTETMLGAGLLLSMFVFMGIRAYLGRSYNEDEN
jgi:uncharacterized membrane-anchored protein